MDELENDFSSEMYFIYEEAKRQYGYNGTRFYQMLNTHGALRTAKICLNSKDMWGVFTGLFLKYPDHNIFELTVEAVALKQKYQELFEPEELKRARERLESVEYFPPQNKDIP